MCLKNALSVGLKMWSRMACETALNGINARIATDTYSDVLVPSDADSAQIYDSKP